MKNKTHIQDQHLVERRHPNNIRIRMNLTMNNLDEYYSNIRMNHIGILL